MKRALVIVSSALAAVCLLGPRNSGALVRYDTGRMTVGGVELFQDANDPTRYFYLPTAPSLALWESGAPQLLCIKFVDPQGNASGGLLHFLATLELPPDQIAELEKELTKKLPGAKLAGALPLLEAKAEQGKESASFQVVSAVLSSTGEGGFTRSLITSGHAPLTPGSRAAVAATLDPKGATLLWDSLNGATSDVSVSLAAEYEAMVRGYNATISAEVNTVYEHFSAVLNKQQGYTKRELRQIVDKLAHDNVLKVEVFDRSKSLGIDATAMEGILSLVTDKLVNLIFDAQAGLAKMPEREAAVEKGQIERRQSRGAFVKWFAGTGDQPYVTDNQFVLKSRKDVRRTTFNLLLARDTTIRVPVYLAGNMGGLYREYRNNQEVFRVVNLADPAFQSRDVRFVLDSEWASLFPTLVNWVAVTFRKEHGEGRDATTDQAQLTGPEVSKGTLERVIRYPRLGAQGADWLGYQYRVSWSLIHRDLVKLPKEEGKWLSGTDPVVTLRPPLALATAELEVDRDLMVERGVKVAVVEVEEKVLGKAESRRAAVLRVTDTEPVVKLTAVHDPAAEPRLRVTWQAARGGERKAGPWLGMGAGYLLLEPPDMNPPKGMP